MKARMDSVQRRVSARKKSFLITTQSDRQSCGRTAVRRAGEGGEGAAPGQQPRGGGGNYTTRPHLPDRLAAHAVVVFPGSLELGPIMRAAVMTSSMLELLC